MVSNELLLLAVLFLVVVFLMTRNGSSVAPAPAPQPHALVVKPLVVSAPLAYGYAPPMRYHNWHVGRPYPWRRW